MKLALLTTDSREHFRAYGKASPEFGTGPEALLGGLAGLADLEVHVISCAQERMQSPARLAPNIFFHCLHVPKRGWMRTLYQGCVRAVRRKLRELKPDLVHGQGTERDCALSAVFSGIPNVITVHGNMRRLAKLMQAAPFSFAWLAARLEAITIPRSDGVVCLTQHTRDQVSSLARRTWVLPNALDPSFFDVEPKPRPQGQARILCVGDVYRLKNQNTLIRALDPLASGHKLELLLFGRAQREQPYAAEFFALLETRSWCVYGGFAEREHLKAHLRDATALVLPSLEENCPMAVLEAMAAGVPVIAANVGGVPELITDGETGFLCNPMDGASIARAVERAISNPSSALEVAARARQRARERFEPKRIARKHLEIYHALLEERHGGRREKSCAGTLF